MHGDEYAMVCMYVSEKTKVANLTTGTFFAHLAEDCIYLKPDRGYFFISRYPA